MPFISLFLVLIVFVLGVWMIIRLIRSTRKSNWIMPTEPFPSNWRRLLVENIAFYNGLNDDEKKLFEGEVQEFIANVKITGSKIAVDDLDRILVASSAVIPIFAFPDWKYYYLDEVILYPSSFNQKFETKGANNSRNILGMVGSGGYMEGKMILSKLSLHQGFTNPHDGRNTAIHEFIHLIDKNDGTIDGLPAVLLDNIYTLPWLDLIDKKIKHIRKNHSDIRPYGGTNRMEFFAVLGEYFFEKPKELRKNHPKLYDLLADVFNQDLAPNAAKMQRLDIGRNDPCFCGSGKKFKKCCGR